jgi:hypothetical protein
MWKSETEKLMPAAVTVWRRLQSGSQARRVMERNEPKEAGSRVVIVQSAVGSWVSICCGGCCCGLPEAVEASRCGLCTGVALDDPLLIFAVAFHGSGSGLFEMYMKP